jgi:signal transduction histidine kinase/streptogramin lyase
MLKDGKLTTYGERDGFPPSRLNTVFEDRSGRLWVGTRSGGLLLFKDNRFISYTTAAGLLGNDVSSIFQDREGTIWVGTTAGLSRMSERVVTTYDAHDGIAGNNVYPIYEDRQRQIWIGSWNGLTRYSGGIFTNVGKQYDVADAQVTSLFEDRDGGFWIGTWSHGVKRVKDGAVTAFAPQQPPGTQVRAIIQDRLGTVWFGTGVGLVKYQEGVFTTYTAKDGFSGGEIFVIHEDKAGQLWLGTDAGLVKFVDGIFTSFTVKDGMAANIVRTVTEDSEGALWIGMYDSGLYRFKQGRFTHFTTNEGLFDNGAFRIIDDGKANFWISCNLGIYRVRKADLNDLAEGRMRKVNSIPYNKSDGMLNSECNGAGQPAGIKASDGRIWFPTQQGVVVINPDAVPINSQPPPVIIESFIIDTQPVALHSPVTIQPGQIYFEVRYSGLSFINPELVKFKYKLEGLDKDWIDASTRRVAYYSHLPAGTYRFVVAAANRDGVWNEQGATIQIIVLPSFWRTWWFLSLSVLSVALVIYLFFRQRIVKLKRENRAQEHFSRQLIESQENERKRIAAELHDGVGQSLLIIKNRAAMGRRFIDNRAMTLEQIDQVEEVAAQSIKELRQIAYDLRPYQIDNVGLTDALKELVRRINEAGPVKINSSVAFVDDLSEEKAINLFRIMQEALNNIVKHSGASEATAIVKRGERVMVMTIEDNGCGFNTEQIRTEGSRGLGLSGLSERARMMNANLTVHSTIGRGTTVRLKMDLEDRDDEE